MAGVVLVQKFIQPGGKAYTGYVDYIDRPEAIGSRSDLRDYDIFGTYQEYMGNPEKSTGVPIGGKSDAFKTSDAFFNTSGAIFIGSLNDTIIFKSLFSFIFQLKLLKNSTCFFFFVFSN